MCSLKIACLQDLLVKMIAFSYPRRKRHWKGKIIYEIFIPYYLFIHTFKKTKSASASLKFFLLYLIAFSFVMPQLITLMLVFLWAIFSPPLPAPLVTYVSVLTFVFWGSWHYPVWFSWLFPFRSLTIWIWVQGTLKWFHTLALASDPQQPLGFSFPSIWEALLKK